VLVLQNVAVVLDHLAGCHIADVAGTNAVVIPELRTTGSAAVNIVVARPAASERRPDVVADATTRLT
jgi:hypothetical protein